LVFPRPGADYVAPGKNRDIGREGEKERMREVKRERGREGEKERVRERERGRRTGQTQQRQSIGTEEAF
jgi:hypothetical protein